MATASRRFSRKQLRQPDWFQGASENALEYFESHKTLVFSAAAAIVAIIAIVWGWQGFKARQDVAASHEFTRAVALYQSEKYRDAIPAFETVQSFRWSRYSVLAHLYLAHSYLATKEIDKAMSAAQRSLTATSPNTLYRQIALFTLAGIEEQKNQCQAAIEHYNEAQKIAGALQSNAALGKARCAEQVGDTKTAIVTYREYLKENPGSPFAIKLSELEARGSQGAAAKIGN
jgi:predicted negative regulator of RcsB-dependent stress response